MTRAQRLAARARMEENTEQEEPMNAQNTQIECTILIADGSPDHFGDALLPEGITWPESIPLHEDLSPGRQIGDGRPYWVNEEKGIVGIRASIDAEWWGRFAPRTPACIGTTRKRNDMHITGLALMAEDSNTDNRIGPLGPDGLQGMRINPTRTDASD